jgi:hypothetical protein
MIILKLSLVVIWTLVGVVLFSELILGKDLWRLAWTRLNTPKPVKPVPQVKPAPQVTVIQETEIQEEAEEEDALANVQIFKKKIKARTTFYTGLSDSLKTEFKALFVEDGPQKLVSELRYVINGQNDGFFEKVFNYVYQYRKVISLGLLQALTDELLTLADNDPNIQTILYEAAIRVAYFRRKDKAFLNQAEQWAKLDVALHQNQLRTRNQAIYSFTRLAIILERKGQIKEALDLVETSIKIGVKETTKTGLAGRKERLLKKLSKQG